jgi:hypothetical protein
VAIIEDNSVESKSGFNKEIEASALTMMLDNLQVFMYQKPVQSTVRECTSNALDAIKEKNVALNILSGKNKVSDYFVERQGVIYEDSKFDKDYYDTEWLSKENTVTLTYINNPDALARDTFVIEDTGVGLGGVRLEKYFSLGYSSKRLSAETLGKFGLGNKSPLSTGVESYRIISRYNGKQFAFDVFSHKVDCVYSKWGEDGSINKYYEFQTVKTQEGESYRAFYKDTNLKNGLRIEVDVKKFNKHQYLEAVKSQLMYFKEDIHFNEVRGDASIIPIPFKSKVVFENDDVILSDSNYFSRPHFVLKGVSYGAIDFRELEMDNRFGSVGIKLEMEDIDVNPSRESIIYNTRTREAVTNKYNKVATAVTDMINKSMKSEDFLEWVAACNAIFYSNGFKSAVGSVQGDVIYRLSGLIDKTTLDLRHPTKKISYFSDINQFIPKGLKVETLGIESKYNNAKRGYVQSIKRSNATTSNALTNAVYLQFSGASAKTTKYLFEKHPQGFTIVKPDFREGDLEKVMQSYVYDKLTYADAEAEASKVLKALYSDDSREADYTLSFAKALKMLSFLKESSAINVYDDTMVPDTFKFTEDEDLDDVDLNKAQKSDYKKVVKERKAQGKFVIGRCANKNTTMTSRYVFTTSETTSDAIKDDNVVYGYTKDVPSLAFLCFILSKKFPSILDEHHNNIHGWTSDLKICKIAQNNKKFLLDKMHVDDYILDYRDGVLTTGDLLKEYFTVQFIQRNLKKSEYFTNFSIFDQELSKTYSELITKARGYSLYSLPNTIKSFQVLQNAAQFQLFKLDHPDADEDLLDIKGVELLGEDIIDDIDNIDIIDKEVYNKVLWLNKFTEVYGGLLNELSCLRTTSAAISEELERDIKDLIALKRDQLELDYPNLNV